MPECFVAKAADLKDGDRRIVIAGAQEIGVFCKDGAYYVYGNYCVHSGAMHVFLHRETRRGWPEQVRP